MEEGMCEVEVASLGLDKSSNTPVVILKEKAGEAVLPIWIGPGEASAIAMKLAGIEFSRPLTHDLLTSVVDELGSHMIRVLITKVVDNTYYASLVFRHDGQTLVVDARPSDSIALALRAEAPIYAEEGLLELTSFDVQEADLEEPEETEEFLEAGAAGAAGGGVPGEATGEGSTEEQSPEQGLKEYLEGLNPEDFGRFTP